MDNGGMVRAVCNAAASGEVTRGSDVRVGDVIGGLGTIRVEWSGDVYRVYLADGSVREYMVGRTIGYVVERQKRRRGARR